MEKIITNRDLSFVTLADGSLQTFEARPRSVVPEGIILAGTTVSDLKGEKLKGIANTNVGVLEDGRTIRLHDNHLSSREQNKERRSSSTGKGIVTITRAIKTPEQQLAEAEEAYQAAMERVEEKKKAEIAAARAVLEEAGELQSEDEDMLEENVA